MNHPQPVRQGRAGDQAVRRAGRCSAGMLGVAGSVTCAASMIAAAVGVGGSAAASGMAAMTGPAAGTPGGMLGDLVRAGPWLLTVSVLLVTAAFALTRRPVTAVPALLAGAVAYAGMYAQPSLAVMYVSIGAVYLTWAGLILWVRAGARK